MMMNCTAYHVHRKCVICIKIYRYETMIYTCWDIKFVRATLFYYSDRYIGQNREICSATRNTLVSLLSHMLIFNAVYCAMCD